MYWSLDIGITSEYYYRIYNNITEYWTQIIIILNEWNSGHNFDKIIVGKIILLLYTRFVKLVVSIRASINGRFLEWSRYARWVHYFVFCFQICFQFTIAFKTTLPIKPTSYIVSNFILRTTLICLFFCFNFSLNKWYINKLYIIFNRAKLSKLAYHFSKYY